MAVSTSGLSYRLSASVLTALAVFILLNLTAILHIRGVADQEGFILNTSKFIPVNTYEDDAQVSIFHALWYVGETKDTFTVATNFGGPLLHLAKPVLWLGSKIGLIKRFDDVYLYVTYPEELARVFKLFSIYKLALLTLLPLSMYWLLANFFSQRAGELAAWLVAAMPFLTGFELRLKPDGLVFALAMLSVLHQLEFIRSARSRHLYLAAVLMALSFSMKFTLASIGVFFCLSFVAGIKRQGYTIVSREAFGMFARATGLALAVFVLANPRILPGLAIFADFVVRYSAVTANADNALGIWGTLGFRLLHFESFVGPWLNYLVLPAVLLAVIIALRDRLTLTPWTYLVGLFTIHLFFIWKVGHHLVVKILTYYYYTPALLVLLFLALFLDYTLKIARDKPVMLTAAYGAIITVIVLTFGENHKVLTFVTGPSTRQQATAWMEANLPRGASLGLPLPSAGHFVFNDRFLVDPFRYRLFTLGLAGERVHAILPDYFVEVRTNPIQNPPLSPSGYEPIAVFDSGSPLPREMFGSYQDDIYTVFRRVIPGPASLPPGPADADFALGLTLASDPERSFALISYKASGIFPLSLNVWFRDGGRYTPVGASLFTASVRSSLSPPAYLHQLSPDLLMLWGVKYVQATVDQAFTQEVLNGGRFDLEPLPIDTPLPEGMRLYRNRGYKGMAHFLPDPRPQEVYECAERWGGILLRHRLKTYGELYPAKLWDTTRPQRLRVRMEVTCDAPMDMLLKGGAQTESILLGSGHNFIDYPYTIGDAPSGLSFEINPTAPGASCRVRSLRTEPLRIESAATAWSISLKEAFVTVDVDKPGELTLSLPYHPFWHAVVGGVEVAVHRGCGNTVSVPVQPGHQLISVRYE